MSNPVIYTVGGTVQAEGGIYIPRRADEELLALCRSRTFAYVLTPRQMGKSSLMVQTANTLQAERVCTVIIDLTEIGTQATPEEWYLGLLTLVADQLELDTDPLDWWEQHEHLGFTQRLTRFFKEVVLAEVAEPIVVFVDEIDTTLSLGFTDDFFVAIRYFYTARAQNHGFERLSFVLVGVATPADLIRDPQRTPFNVGQRVNLTDFLPAEVSPLAAGLGMTPEQAQQVLGWVLEWTSGHPYLTQRLCQAVVEKRKRETENGKQSNDSIPSMFTLAPYIATPITRDTIDDIAAATFFGPMSEQDNNLQFVRDMLTQRAPDIYAVLTTYKDIWQGRLRIVDEEQSIVKSHLKLAGVVRREPDKTLWVRNRIYEMVFDDRWLRENLPVNWRRRVQRLRGAIAAGAVVMMGMAGLTGWALVERGTAKQERGRAEAALVEVENQRNQAVRSAQEAQVQRVEAEKAKSEAEKAKSEAEEAKSEAEERRGRAESAEKQAVKAQKAEVEQRQIAESQREIALEAQSVAEDATRRGNEQRLLTLSKQLVERALNRLDNLDLSLLLSVEAYAISKSPLTKGSILTALQSSPSIDTFLHGHESKVWDSAFSSDENILITGGGGGKAIVWDLSQEKIIRTIEINKDDEVRALALNDNGKTLATASTNGNIALWNLKTGGLIRNLKINHKYEFRDIQFSEDATKLAAGDSDGNIFIWNMNSDHLITLKSPEDAIRSLGFSPDGKRLLSAGSKGEIKIWNSENGNIIEQSITPGSFNTINSEIFSVTYSPDGKTFASSNGSGIVSIWDSETLRLKIQEVIADQDTAPISSIAYSPDGEILGIATTGKGVRLFNIKKESFLDSKLTGQTGWISSVSFDQNGKKLVSTAWDGSVAIWNLPVKQHGGESLLGDHNVNLGAVQFSPNGKSLVAGGMDGSIILWNAQNYSKRVKLPRIHSGSVLSLAFSSDNKLLATGSSDGSIVIWKISSDISSDILSAEAIFRFSSENLTPITSISFSFNNEMIAFSSCQRISDSCDLGEITLKSLIDRNFSKTVPAHESWITKLSFLQDPELIVSGGQDGSIVLWNTKNLDKISDSSSHDYAVSSMVLRADEKILASSDISGQIYIWAFKDGGLEKRQAIKIDEQIGDLEFSQSGKELIATTLNSSDFSQGSKVISWDLENIGKGNELIFTSREALTNISIDYKQGVLALLSQPGSAYLLEMDSKEIRNEILTGYSADISDLIFDPASSDTLISYGFQSSQIFFWDMKGNKKLDELSFYLNSGRVPLSISSNKKFLVTNNPYGGIDLIDFGNKRILATITDVKASSFAFSPNNDLLAIGICKQWFIIKCPYQSEIILWDLVSQKKVDLPLVGHKDLVFKMSFSPDGKTLATVGLDKQVILWDMRTRKQLFRPLEGHEFDIFAVAFSPDGRMLATGGRDLSIILWDVVKGQKVGTLSGHTNSVFSLAFSPDGKTIASSSGDQTVRLWDVESQELISSLGGHQAWVISLAFSRDGKTIASGSKDGEIIFWNIDPTFLANRACEIAGRSLTEQEWNYYIPNVPFRNSCANDFQKVNNSISNFFEPFRNLLRSAI